MDTVIVVDLIKGTPTPWPRLENDVYLMSAGSQKPLEDAFRISQLDMCEWMAAQFGFDRLDAYQLLTQASETPIANVVDPNYTVITKLRKAYLPSIDAYGGMHARLLEMAAAYRSAKG